MLRFLTPRLVYVKVFENRFILKLLEDGHTPVTAVSTTPFTTKRLLVGNFTAAASTLKESLRQLLAGRWLATRPAMLIHPTEKVDGGLSQVDERIFLELGTSSGACKVHVWQGHELTDTEAREHAAGSARTTP